MKSISVFFLSFVLIMFYAIIPLAADMSVGVAINHSYVDGSLSLDQDILKVYYADRSLAYSRKAKLSWSVTAGCTVLAGSYGTLDISAAGNVMWGSLGVDVSSGGRPYPIGQFGLGLWPIRYDETYSFTVWPSSYYFETENPGTYELYAKAKITRTSSSSGTSVSLLGVSGNVGSPPATLTYDSSIGMKVDSKEVKEVTRTLSPEFSQDPCRIMVIDSSGSITLDPNCYDWGGCPPRAQGSTRGLTFRYSGSCGGYDCDCNYTPPEGDSPDSDD